VGFPDEHWHRMHRLGSFAMIAGDILPGMAFTTIPFLLGIYVASRSARRLRV
jgi:hypothetical protein